MRQIYAAADMFGLEELSKGALDAISRIIALTTFGDIYVFARTFQQPELASKAVAFWLEHLAEAREEGNEANQQAKIITIEHLEAGGQDECRVFAETVFGVGLGGQTKV